jgi:ribonuclease P protein component
VKRRLRELSRTRLLPADVAADIVIRIRPDAYRAAFSALAADIDRILARLANWGSTDTGAPVSLESAADSGSSDT